MVPADRKYTQEHEWIMVEGAIGAVGLTEFAAHELGDIVFVELPAVGSTFRQGDSVGTIESVKAVADLYLPVSGEIVAVNDAVTAGPDLLNRDPFGEGWLVKVKIGAPGELEALLDAAAYGELLGG